MGLFTKQELRIVDALANNKKPDADPAQVKDLGAKLGAPTAGDIPARFASLTGWTNAPKDYPL